MALFQIKLKASWKPYTTKLSSSLTQYQGDWDTWSWKSYTWRFDFGLRNARIKMSGAIQDSTAGQIKTIIHYKDGTQETYTRTLPYAGGGTRQDVNHTFNTAANKEISHIWYEVGVKRHGGWGWIMVEILSYERKG